MESNHVILVNEADEEIGTMEKLAAHQAGLLHRAISVFIFNSAGELLLQRRALDKYHSSGLWTNTCCSHPYPGETASDAAHRRLKEEMGMEANLQPSFQFIYKTDLDHNLTEYELDHVFVGQSDETPHLNTEEAIAFRWASLDKLKEEIATYPDRYTVWFRIILTEHLEKLEQLSYESL